MTSKEFGQFVLDFRSPEDIAEQEEAAKRRTEWLNTPSPPPPPPLPPLPGWENAIPGRTRCEIVRSQFPADVGKVVVIRRRNGDHRSVWVSDDEPAVHRKNTKGRWVCQWDPLSAQRPMSMEDLRILPDPWVPRPPIRD
jgi:hypothetical protein